MKVTSKKTLRFPSLQWGINAGQEKSLPENEEAQKVILAHPAITVAGGTQQPSTVISEQTKEN